MTEPRVPLRRSIELDIGESAEVELSEGKRVAVRLLDLEETRDPLRSAIRRARARVSVDGVEAWVGSGNYELPAAVGAAQIDCPVTRGFLVDGSGENKWALGKDARLRLWPAGAPWIAPGTLVYPLAQRWFAAGTQMSNEPTFVNGGEGPRERIYYHWGLDFGGAEGMVDALAAADGVVVAAGERILDGHENLPDRMTYDGVYIVDERGWYHGYFHLCRIDVAIGQRLEKGTRIGVLGKEGGSGGWAHLHYVIRCRQPSGRWGVEEAYPYVWQAYVDRYAPPVIAVARPHAVVGVGQTVSLDAGRSRSFGGAIREHEWTFADGARATGAEVERTYARIGTYSEILKVTDDRGNVAYDFATVQVVPEDRPAPSIHAAYAPTLDLRPGQELTFKVRSFKAGEGREVWDFGDGSGPVTVRSDGNREPRAADGYAVTTHAYRAPGDYIARAERRTPQGEVEATAHLHVRVAGRTAALSALIVAALGASALGRVGGRSAVRPPRGLQHRVHERLVAPAERQGLPEKEGHRVSVRREDRRGGAAEVLRPGDRAHSRRALEGALEERRGQVQDHAVPRSRMREGGRRGRGHHPARRGLPRLARVPGRGMPRRDHPRRLRLGRDAEVPHPGGGLRAGVHRQRRDLRP